jgi:hypothetical protein
MMTLFAAAAMAAAQPAPSAPMGKMPAGEHAMKEKCCCDEMAKKHEGHSEHDAHSGE